MYINRFVYETCRGLDAGVVLEAHNLSAQIYHSV